MFPLDLPGPEFLGLYFFYGAAVVLCIYMLWNRHKDAGSGHQPVLRDPYQVAYLRGGAREAIRLAVMGLIERRILEWKGGADVAATVRPESATRHSLEAAVTRVFDWRRPATDAESDHTALSAAHTLRAPLEAGGYLLSEEARAIRARLAGAGLAALWTLGGLKLTVALSAGRKNVGFLILMMIGWAIVLLAMLYANSRTHRGTQALRDLRGLTSGPGAERPAIGSMAGPELMLTAAVWGIAAMPVLGNPYENERRQSAFFGCGSSGGDGGGGGGCGGSGGGGCGGCGGGD